MQDRENAEKNEKMSFIARWLTKKVLGIIGLVIVLVAVGIGLGKTIFTDSETTNIGFEDIGELATQAAYCTEVSTIEGARDLFGVIIPFTESKYIYSYDVVIRAGLDFTEIEWEERNDRIEVRLPEIRILSSEIDLDSFKVYHEDESIFRQVTLEENNEALRTLQQTAEQDAIANGLLENARNNAETILTGFFASAYDMNVYAIEFSDK